MSETLTIHPVCDLFPDLPPDELKLLADDIKANGQRERITTFHGIVIDGKNRLHACELAGVTPQTERLWEIDSIAEEEQARYLINYALSKNLARRNLTPAQRGAIVVQAKELLDRLTAAAKQRQADALAQQAKQRQRESAAAKEIIKSPLVGNHTNEKKRGRVREVIAKTADISPDTAAQLIKIQQRAPERLAAIASGKKSIAESLINLPAPKTPATAAAKKKSYPKLPAPPVLPATNAETMRKLQQVQDALEKCEKIVRPNLDLIDKIRETMKICNVDEYQTVQRVAKRLSDFCDKVKETDTHFFWYFARPHSNPQTYAASCAEEISKAEPKPEAWTFQTNDNDVIEALKVALAPLGYRKTMGLKFKRVESVPDLPLPSARRKKTRKVNSPCRECGKSVRIDSHDPDKRLCSKCFHAGAVVQQAAD